jgi:hypothetical protein
MPIHKGPLPIDGTLGNVSFYTDCRGKNRVRRKGGPSKDKMKPRSLKNADDFGYANLFAARMAGGLNNYKGYNSDSDYFNRLCGLSRSIQLTDITFDPGERRTGFGNVYLFEGFQWNDRLHLQKALATEISCNVDSSTGHINCQFIPFIPSKDLRVPAGATHFQLLLYAVYMDMFSNQVKHYGSGGESAQAADEAARKAVSSLIPVNDTATDFISLSWKLKLDPPGVILVSAGLVFYKEEWGVPEPIRNKGAQAIIRVERVGDHPLGSPIEDGSRTGLPIWQPGLSPDEKRVLSTQLMLEALPEILKKKMPKKLPVAASDAQRNEWEDNIRTRMLSHWQKKLDEYRYGKKK